MSREYLHLLRVCSLLQVSYRMRDSTERDGEPNGFSFLDKKNISPFSCIPITNDTPESAGATTRLDPFPQRIQHVLPHLDLTLLMHTRGISSIQINHKISNRVHGYPGDCLSQSLAFLPRYLTPYPRSILRITVYSRICLTPVARYRLAQNTPGFPLLPGRATWSGAIAAAELSHGPAESNQGAGNKRSTRDQQAINTKKQASERAGE